MESIQNTTHSTIMACLCSGYKRRLQLRQRRRSELARSRRADPGCTGGCLGNNGPHDRMPSVEVTV